MADAIELPKPVKKPPDFTAPGSRWRFTDMLSVHAFPTNPYKPKWQVADPTDARMDSWMINVRNYLLPIDDHNSAIGNEYHFFGRDLRVKYWGLEGDKEDAKNDKEEARQSALHSFGYLRPDNVWEVFSNLEYEVGYEPVFGIGKDSKKVITVMLTVKRRREKHALLGLNVSIKRE